MVSDSQQDIVTPSLKSWGLYVEKYRDIVFPQERDGRKFFFPVIKGRFDMHVNVHSRIAYIELKNFDRNFSFSSIDEDKRHWSSVQEQFDTWCAVFLILGSDPPHYVFPKYRPKVAWLFSMATFYAMEDLMNSYGRKSLPYCIEDAREKKVKQDSADAIHLLRQHQLEWKNGLWRLPESHGFREVMGLYET